MSRDGLRALGADPVTDDVRRAVAGMRAISQPFADDVRLNPAQQKVLVAFDDGTIVVADGDRHSPLVSSAVRYSEGKRGAPAELVHLPLRTVERIQAVLLGDTQHENTAGTTGEERLWASILNFAAGLRAADVLVRAELTGAEVHVTVDGFRQPAPFDFPVVDAVRMCGVLYQMSSGRGEFDAKVSQRSSLTKERLSALGVDRRVTSARLQFNPAPNGVNVFIRLADQRSFEGISFAGYRLPAATAMVLADQRACDAGVITLCGPPGAGKTTLQALQLMTQQRETDGTRTILLLEDTLEITEVPGVYVVPVPYRDTEERDKQLDLALEEVLRSAAQTLCVGEVRSVTAARMMFRGAQTGVQVITTVHALSALGSVARYARMGVEESDVFDPTINRGAVGQRLLPRLCTNCRIPLRDVLTAAEKGTPLPGDRDTSRFQIARERWTAGIAAAASVGRGDDEALPGLGEWPVGIYLRGEGCDACRKHTTAGASARARGAAGRQPVVEAVLFDEDLLAALARGDRRTARAHAVEACGLVPMIAHGASLALEGRVSPEDVEASIGRFGDQAALAGER
jgi:type II secretory ATPase GspE/PulE/Tfp pilus assembly ATPase PilB-like protein